MKKTLFTLISALALNFAQADENTPVNFHPDQRVGQFNANMKIVSSDETTKLDQKICFVPGGMRDKKSPGKFEDGCTGKKLKDTSTELEYLVSCPGRSEIHMTWTRFSTNDFAFTSKDSQLEIETTYKYVGENCDADAIRK